MRAGRVAIGIVAIVILAMWAWRSQLFTVSKPGEAPRALAAIAEPARRNVPFDVVMPVVPVGMMEVRPGGQALVVHYWAPWEKHSLAQAAALDSLMRLDEFTGLRVVIVCFDPFPSVARYVARNRLRVPVLLDLQREMRRALPCPSVPYTYVFDPAGRIAVEQAGEVDWLEAGTREVLQRLLGERAGAGRPRGAAL